MQHHSSTSSFTAAKRDDENQILNTTTHIPDYTQGLDGLNQIQTYLFTNTNVAFFFILCGIVVLVRLYLLRTNYFRQMVACSSGNERPNFFAMNHNAIWPWWKKNVQYAPLWKKRHNKEIQLSKAVSIGTLPSRFHFVLLAIYIIGNIVFCATLGYGTQVRAATIAELRGRSGILAAFNIIPTVLFALRNNPFIPLLQVSYDTFNLMHRWLGRLVVLESLVHVLAWGGNAIATGGTARFRMELHDTVSFQWGFVSMIAFFLILVQAWSPVRHAFYETFLAGHRVIAFVAILGAYIHLQLAQLPQLPYIQLTWVLWCLEWAIRTGRIVYYNYSFRRQTTVVVEAFSTDACRVTFDLARPWKPQPGCHVHVYLPRISLWSSHPFSVAWTGEYEMDTLSKVITEKGESATAPSTSTTVSLVIRAQSGMTRKLHNLASKSPNKVVSLRGFIEGPYGGHESLDSYGTVLLFAGGVGITHQLMYIRHLLAGAEAGTVAARKIVLVWTIPQKECMEWVRPWLDEILAMPGRKEFLQIITYVTKDKGERIVSASGAVQMIPGRCKAEEVVERQFQDRIGSMVVTVCGPGAFADDIRAAVRGKVDQGNIEFIEEAFTY